MYKQKFISGCFGNYALCSSIIPALFCCFESVFDGLLNLLKNIITRLFTDLKDAAYGN